MNIAYSIHQQTHAHENLEDNHKHHLNRNPTEPAILVSHVYDPTRIVCMTGLWMEQETIFGITVNL